MKVFSSKRQRYVVIISIVVVAVALIVWFVTHGRPAYDLTIASSAGGSVSTPWWRLRTLATALSTGLAM